MSSENLIRAIRARCGREGISNEELRQFGSGESDDYGPVKVRADRTADADDDGWLRQEPDR